MTKNSPNLDPLEGMGDHNFLINSYVHNFNDLVCQVTSPLMLSLVSFLEKSISLKVYSMSCLRKYSSPIFVHRLTSRNT